MQKIYVLDIKDIAENEQLVKSFLPLDAVMKSDGYAESADRLRSLGGALLIKAFTANSPLLYDELKKPYKKEPPFFNVSHFFNKVGIFLNDNGAVGFDIQLIKEYNEKLVDYVFKGEERRLVNDGKTFAAMWTKKESAVKLTGEGVASIRKQILTEISDKSYIFNGKKIFYKTFLSGDYAITASSFDPVTAQITEITVKEIIK